MRLKLYKYTCAGVFTVSLWLAVRMVYVSVTLHLPHRDNVLIKLDETGQLPSSDPESHAGKVLPQSWKELRARQSDQDKDVPAHAVASADHVTRRGSNRATQLPQPVDTSVSHDPLILYQDRINRVPYKIYVYNLPPGLNTDLLECVNTMFPNGCFNTQDEGFGPGLPDTDHLVDKGLSVRDTWQFSLEVIMHHKVLSSPLRVLDPAKADVFYIPYYGAAMFFCHLRQANSSARAESSVNDLVKFLTEQEPFNSGRPHVMTLGKIEREMGTKNCPVLKNKRLHTVAFIGIEQEVNARHRMYLRGVSTTPEPIMVVPYPSYGHLTGNTTVYEDTLYSYTRRVLVLLAAATRRSNPLRAKLLDQLNNRTSLSFDQFFEMHTRRGHDPVDQVWLVTPECNGNHKKYTIQWMRNSVFCLQPPGDSPTRKSFYDAIVSGCIPVILKGSRFKVKYPFDDVIDYSQFTVSVPEVAIEKRQIDIVEFLKTIPDSDILNKQRHLLKVLRYLQYSYPISPGGNHTDAVSLILQSLSSIVK